MKAGRWSLAAAVVIVAAVPTAHYFKERSAPPAPIVQVEPVSPHDLISSVTATGQLEPHNKVDVIADATGRVMRLAVHEGDFVTKGQFLLEIDPSEPRAAKDRSAAAVASARSNASQARTNLALASRQYQRTAELQKENAALVAEDEVDKLRTQVVLDSALLDAANHAVDEAMGSLRQSESALAKTTITAPMSGKITRLSVAEGETAIPGTFSRDAATLLTISDMSILETKIMVPEADIARLQVGDSATISIQAFPDSSFPGRVESISNSSARDAGASGASSQGGGSGHVVNYEVTVRLLRVPDNVHPDFSATATIIAATRRQTLAVPIIALTLRETPIPSPRTDSAGAAGRPVPVVPPSAPTATRGAPKMVPMHDAEGVFVLGRGDTAHFHPVSTGIMGERYIELLDGVKAGDRVVAGPYDVVRDLRDGAFVRTQ